MPNRTIYIKNEDIAIWDKVFSPEWLHTVIQLAGDPPVAKRLPKGYENDSNGMLKP